MLIRSSLGHEQTTGKRWPAVRSGRPRHAAHQCGERTTAAPCIRFEGRLAGMWVREADTHWATARAMAGATPLTVDLRDLVSVDAGGEQLLARMQRDGAQLVVSGCAMRALVAELNGAPDDEARGPGGGAALAAVVGKDVSGES